MMNLTGQLPAAGTTSISDFVKQKNSLSVWDDVICNKEIEWAQFFGFPKPSINCCDFYERKGVNFWFPHCEQNKYWKNIISNDGLTIMETKPGHENVPSIQNVPDKRYPIRLVFPCFRDAKNDIYFKFVGLFQYSDKDSAQGLIHVYKRISDRLIWKNGNPADFEW